MVERFRAAWNRILTPVARWLLARGVSPDVVTWVGTVGVVVAALLCFPQGWLWQGALAASVFALSDMVDGRMARLSGRTSGWGAFLDSTLDRIGDGALFGGIALYFAASATGDAAGAGASERTWAVVWVGVTLAALVLAQVTSYVKAKADALKVTVPGGVAARADRVIILLVAAFVAGLGVPWALQIAVSLLTVLSAVTVGQRMGAVHRQLNAADPAAPPARRRPRRGHHHLPSSGTRPAGSDLG